MYFYCRGKKNQLQFYKNVDLFSYQRAQFPSFIIHLYAEVFDKKKGLSIFFRACFSEKKKKSRKEIPNNRKQAGEKKMRSTTRVTTYSKFKNVQNP